MNININESTLKYLYQVLSYTIKIEKLLNIAICYDREMYSFAFYKYRRILQNENNFVVYYYKEYLKRWMVFYHIKRNEKNLQHDDLCDREMYSFEYV